MLFDSQPYFRSQIYPQYKGNREPQGIPFETVRPLLEQHYPCISYEGLEADDLAYLLTKYYDSAVPFILVSSDRDWGQTVDVNKKHNNIMQYCRHKRDFIDYSDTVKEPTWKCKIILGDLGDNVPRAVPSTKAVEVKGAWVEKNIRLGEVTVNKLFEQGMSAAEILKKYDVDYLGEDAQLTYKLIVFNEDLYRYYITGFDKFIEYIKTGVWTSLGEPPLKQDLRI
jgi:5'-3' exonuclease